MPTEIVELRHYNVDINPQYADSLDVELFKIHVMFETHEETLDTLKAGRRGAQPDKVMQLPPYHKLGVEAFEAGLDEVVICVEMLVDAFLTVSCRSPNTTRWCLTQPNAGSCVRPVEAPRMGTTSRWLCSWPTTRWTTARSWWG